MPRGRPNAGRNNQRGAGTPARSMPGQATGKAMQQRTQATGQMAPRALGTAATNKTAATKKAPAPARLKPGAATKTAATSGTTRKTAGAKSPAKRKQSRNASMLTQK